MAVRLLLLAILAAVSFGVLAVYVNSTEANDPAKFIVNSSTDPAIGDVDGDGFDDGDGNPGDGVCDTVAGPPVICTLRGAITESNNLDGPNVINFTATNTKLLTLLPTITERLTIDASANPDGFSIDASNVVDGLTLGVGSSGSVIMGLNIFDATGDGLVILGGASNTIGGDPSAGAAPTGEGNAFHGSGDDGIEIRLGSQGGHTLIGNRIGTAPDGLSPDGNAGHGINISGGTGADITIGGFPNLISANVDGVEVFGGTPDVTIQNNWIGLDANGSASDPFANASFGIHLLTDDNTVLNNRIAGGGVTPADNPGDEGIGFTSDRNTILGNCIGFDSDCDGTAGGFMFEGIECLGGDDNIIGDGTDDGRNVIGNTTLEGILLGTVGAACDGNDVNGNYVGFGGDGEEGAFINDDCIEIEGDSNQIRNNYIGNCDFDAINVGSVVGSAGSNVIGGAKVDAGADSDGNSIGLGTDPATADDINGFCIELNGVGSNTVRNNVMANCGATVPDAALQITTGAGNIIQNNDITSPVGEDAIDIEPVAAGANSGNLIASRIFRMVNQGTGDLPIDLDDNGVTLNDAGDLDPDALNATCLLATPLGANLCHNYPVFPATSGTDGCARGSAGPFDMVRIYIKTTEGNDTIYTWAGEDTANVAGDFTVCIGNTADVTVVGTATTTAASTTDLAAINSTSEFSITEQTVPAGGPPPTDTPTITDTPGPATDTPTPEPPTDTPIPPTETAVPPPTATPTDTKLCGDVNEDGSVNAVDASLVLQLKAGIISSLTNEASADVNGDGEITSVDAALILQLEGGLISSLTC
ncbi:MAG: hypothetical protein IH959_00355 [Chloroflexi bacterium]|nr:hypothetical protein [Chloroflexota bacterium]